MKPFFCDVRNNITACGLSLDVSRQRITRQEFIRLWDSDEAKCLRRAHSSMVKGKIVNASENRQALHTSLRSFSALLPQYEEVNRERTKVLDFATLVRNGDWCGCRGDRITDVINIGIGGSDVGPRMVYHALKGTNPKIRLHFLSTVDGCLLERILSVCNPLSTLVVISSKSFKTRETLVNASAVDQWLADSGITGSNRAKHIVIASANILATEKLNLPAENLFTFWDWVGGVFRSGVL